MPEEYIVRDHMSTPVLSISQDARLLDAALMLRRSGFRHLPIVDHGRLVGIVTDRDIQRFAPSLLSKITPEEYNAVFENTPLSKVMTRDLITVTPLSPLREAAAILNDRKVGCLPVVEGDQLVGILTRNDLLGVLVRILEKSTAPQEATQKR